MGCGHRSPGVGLSRAALVRHNGRDVGDGVEKWLSLFAGYCERTRHPGVLVDSTNFRMDPANLNWEWRDTNITPRYNAAGVRKFAFHMPVGMPAIGQPPAPDGRADFPTAFFGSRQAALDWLAAK